MLLLWKVILTQIVAAIWTTTQGLFSTLITPARCINRLFAPFCIAGILHMFSTPPQE
jgi:hypothetical protein